MSKSIAAPQLTRVLVPPVVHSSRPVLRKPPTLVGGIVLPVESADCCFFSKASRLELFFADVLVAMVFLTLRDFRHDDGAHIGL